MTVQDQLSTVDLAEADRLISDLAALVDAGLLVVHEHVLGPARYGLVADQDAPDRMSCGAPENADVELVPRGRWNAGSREGTRLVSGPSR
jgi:hypothetical protein